VTIDRDKQLDRLAKLLALASSPNVHEAEAARLAAESLMRRHGLGREEASGRSPSGYYEHPMGARGWDRAWRFALVTAAARSCGTDVVGLWTAGRRKVRVVGIRSDVERAVGLYGDLLAIVEALGRGVGDLSPAMDAEIFLHGGRDCSDAFRRGVVMGLVYLLSRSGGSDLFRDCPPEVERPPGRGGGDRLALVPLGKVKATDRARSRYEPEETSIELDDVACIAWFAAGVRAVQDDVVEDGGSVGLRIHTTKNQQEE
jgi:hypothetical protein